MQFNRLHPSMLEKDCLHSQIATNYETEWSLLLHDMLLRKCVTDSWMSPICVEKQEIEKVWSHNRTQKQSTEQFTNFPANTSPESYQSHQYHLHFFLEQAEHTPHGIN